MSGNGHSRTITSMQGGAGLSCKPSSKNTTTTGREWSCENSSGGKKPPKTTTSAQKVHPCQYRHRQSNQGSSYLAAMTIFRASQAGGASLRADRSLCQQAKTARRYPSNYTRTQKPCFQDHAKAGSEFPWEGY